MAKKKSLSDQYFTFIKSLAEVGKTAKHDVDFGAFDFNSIITDLDLKIAKQQIAYYNMQLEALNTQFNKIKERAEKRFGTFIN